MALIEQPAILPGEFAQEGDKNTIPENNDGLSGLASILKGFPPITQQPLSSGGLPPQRADFNGIFNLFSKFLMYIQSGGIFEYNNTLDYQPPAIVWGNNNFYKCKQANGANTSAGVQSLTNTNYWELVTPIKNITGNNNILTVTNGNNTSDTITINALQNAPTTNDNSNKIPTTSWVQTWVKNFINALDDNLQVQWSSSTFTVPALGITGLMAQNGYISLGKLFGGLILQWGIANLNNVSTFPISFKQLRKIVAIHYGSILSVTLIEDMNYRNNLTSTKLLTSYEYNADAEYIVMGF